MQELRLSLEGQSFQRLLKCDLHVYDNSLKDNVEEINLDKWNLKESQNKGVHVKSKNDIFYLIGISGVSRVKEGRSRNHCLDL